MVLLDAAGLFHDAVVGPHNRLPEEPLPLPVGEGVVVEGLQLAAEVVHQVRLLVNGQVFVALLGQQVEELLLQGGFALVGVRAVFVGGVFGDDSAITGGGDEIVLSHKCLLHLCIIYYYLNLLASSHTKGQDTDRAF